ncbi:MAG: hypothetical protein JNM17_34910 [Archangium sp.]|nr:hypothetical protein [Archangium sp.]
MKPETTDAVPAPKAPWGLPLMAAAVLLAAAPLGSTFFVFFARALREREDGYGFSDGSESAVTLAFQMGGWPMYAVLGAGLVLSVVAAVFVIVSARQNALFALPLPLFIAMPAALGTVGTNWSMDASLLAVAHASPADRATILCGSLSEALWSSTLGACVAAGLALTACAALVLAGFAQSRQPLHARGLFVAAAAAFGLTVLAWFGATASQTASSTWQALANSVPSVQLLGEVVSQLTAAQRNVSVVTLVLVVACLALAAALGAKAGARAAFAVSLLLGVLLLSVSVRAKPPRDFVEAVSSTGGARSSLYVFEAPRTDQVSGIPLEAMPREDLATMVKQTRDLHEAAGDYSFASDRMTLELRPDVSAPALRSALQQLANERVSRVTLLTGMPEAPATAPALPPPFDALLRSSRGVEVKLLFRERDCPCDELQVEENGVRLADEKWAFEPLKDKYVDDYAQPVTLPLDEKLTVDVVLKTANAAMAHDRKLGLVLDGPAPKREDSFDDLYDAPDPPPLAEVTVSDLKVLFGPLTPAVLKKSSNPGTTLSCIIDDEPAFPLTVELELALNEVGIVVGAMPLGARGDDDEFARCVAGFVDFTPVDRVKGFSVVRAKYTFTAPPPPKKTAE